ncbi:MAG: proline racemase family protein [Candidatus Aminicenantales bacterium]
MLDSWQPPPNWPLVTTIESHAAGEPLRVITGGLPKIPGKTMLDKRAYFLNHLDNWRRALMWEPRGHADMYGAIITEPVRAGSDLGVLFLHNQGLSTMCGHGIIALTTVVVEIGLVPLKLPQTEVKIDTPAGLVVARAKIKEGRVSSVSFQNVPSFVLALAEEVEVPGIGRINYDLAFGGAFYAYVEANKMGVDLIPENYRQLIEKGMAIKQAIVKTRSIEHPLEKGLSFLYGTIFTGKPKIKGADSRNVCIFAEGEVDRSPTGTGVSGWLAILSARHRLKKGQQLVVESLISSRFSGLVAGQTKCGPYQAVIPEVKGSAHIIGKCQFFFDPQDPLGSGFFLR